MKAFMIISLILQLSESDQLYNQATAAIIEGEYLTADILLEELGDYRYSSTLKQLSLFGRTREHLASPFITDEPVPGEELSIANSPLSLMSVGDLSSTSLWRDPDAYPDSLRDVVGITVTEWEVFGSVRDLGNCSLHYLPDGPDSLYSVFQEFSEVIGIEPENTRILLLVVPQQSPVVALRIIEALEELQFQMIDLRVPFFRREDNENHFH